MSDQVTETSSQSWISRLMESIKNVLVGLFLFLIAIPLLWWNEGRAVQTYQSLMEGAGAVIAVLADKVDAANEGKLIHLTGKAQTTATVTDPVFGVSANALRLERKAEIFQWVEESKSEKKKKVGGSEETVTTYTYKKAWDDDLADSSRFKEPKGHTNPTTMKYESGEWRASPVTLGAFTMTTSQVDRVPGEEKLTVTADMLKMAAAPAEAATPPPAEEKKEEAAPPPPPADKKAAKKQGKLAKAQAKANKGGSKDAKKPLAAPGAEPKPMARGPIAPKVVDGGIYIGYDAKAPEVGDHKISFTRVPSGAEISVIAQQAGSSFQAYKTKAGDALDIMQPGAKTADQMFKQAQADNVTMTWILRFVFFVMMAIGVTMVFKPLAIVADVVPFFGDILRWGIGLVAVAVAGPVTFLTIAIAWIFYRPVLGVGLLVVGIGALVGIKVLASKRKKTGVAVPA